MTEPEPDDAGHHFIIGLRVRHPTCDLGPVLAPLGIVPRFNRIVGEPRVGAKGRPLPGTFRFSFWVWSESIRGRRDFMVDVARLVDRLEPHEALLRGVVASGGRVAITLALPGDNNIGSVLSFSEMARLAAREIDLEIEVFPHLGNSA